MKKIILSILVIIVLVFLYLKFNQYALIVGDYSFNDKDIQYRQEIIKIYFPEYKGDLREGSIQQLVRAYQFVQILKNNKFDISKEALQKEADRIQRSSQMPEKLQLIQNIFKNDQEAYYRDYILPVYAERVIYFEYFIHNTEIHAATLELAQNVLAVVINQKENNFEKVISSFEKSKNLKVVSLEISDKESSFVAGDELKKWQNEIISKLKVGQVYSEVIDRNEVWMVVRLLNKKKELSNIEAIIIPKANFQEWLEKEKAKVAVHQNG